MPFASALQNGAVIGTEIVTVLKGNAAQKDCALVVRLK